MYVIKTTKQTELTSGHITDMYERDRVFPFGDETDVDDADIHTWSAQLCHLI